MYHRADAYELVPCKTRCQRGQASSPIPALGLRTTSSDDIAFKGQSGPSSPSLFLTRARRRNKDVAKVYFQSSHKGKFLEGKPTSSLPARIFAFFIQGSQCYFNGKMFGMLARASSEM